MFRIRDEYEYEYISINKSEKSYNFRQLFTCNNMYGNVYRLEHSYFSQVHILNMEESLCNLLVSEQLKKSRNDNRQKLRFLVIGNENYASCKTYKKINICNSYQSDYEQKRIGLVYGYIREFESNDGCCIPYKIIECIVRYYEFDGLLFCCYNRKIVDFEYENYVYEYKNPNRIFQWTHIHNTEDISHKCFSYFEEHSAIIYCVSLPIFCRAELGDGNESLRIFDTIINSNWFRKMRIIILFMDYEEFETDIEKGKVIYSYFNDHYSNNLYTGDELYEFLKQKYISKDKFNRNENYYERSLFCYRVRNNVKHDWDKFLDDCQAIAVPQNEKWSG
eukprot:122016_1